MLNHVDALCAWNTYRADADGDRLFDAAMRELSHYHCEHTPGYRRWLQANGLDAAALDGLDDWSRLPPLFANYFKRQLVVSAAGQDALELTSSGTTGQKSRMRYDARSLGAAQSMVTASSGITAGIRRNSRATTCCSATSRPAPSPWAPPTPTNSCASTRR